MSSIRRSPGCCRSAPLCHFALGRPRAAASQRRSLCRIAKPRCSPTFRACQDRSTDRRWPASTARFCPPRGHCSGRRAWRTWVPWRRSAIRQLLTASAAPPTWSRARRTPRCSRRSKRARPTTAWLPSRTRPRGRSTKSSIDWWTRRCRSAPRSACPSRTRCCHARRRSRRSSACCATRRRLARRVYGWPSTCQGSPCCRRRATARRLNWRRKTRPAPSRRSARVSRVRCTG